MISNIFFACARLISCCGKKNCAIPYSLSPPISKPSFLQAFLKNLCEICRRIPTPSPVLPSASLPARCSRCSTILSALATVSWVFLPLYLQPHRYRSYHARIRDGTVPDLLSLLPAWSFILSICDRNKTRLFLVLSHFFYFYS